MNETAALMIISIRKRQLQEARRRWGLDNFRANARGDSLFQPAPRELDGAQQCLRFIEALLIFTGRVGIGDDAGTRL